MVELMTVATGPGLTFDVMVDGAADAPLVLLLHGFCESFHMWRALVPTLAAAGYRAVAPSQRGYSPGARPDTTVHSNYAFDMLIADAMTIATRCGNADRFHLVGHDWGGSLAWAIADRTPERLASLSILSRPHPIAFNRALEMPDGEQKRRSSHHKWFLEPDAGARVIGNNCYWLRERWTRNGMPAEAQARHLAVIGNTEAMEGALAWYRARGAHHRPVGNTVVPTLYIWGDADDTVGRVAAEGTVDCVTSPYQFEALPGGGHFVADQFPERVNSLLLAHIAKYPV